MAKKDYKQIVAQIRDLHWHKLKDFEMQQLMYLAYISALEFAESLRIVERLYSDNPSVRKLVAGELQTDNLRFGDYDKQGDHAAFLEYFLRSDNIQPREEVRKAGDIYMMSCRRYSEEVRAMSVFSREEELSGIFERILEALNWSGTALQAYRYFLETHIRLDSSEGGHHDLIKVFPVDHRVSGFYGTRLRMYECLPSLFPD